MYNKSKTYIYPLIHNYLELNHISEKHLTNTYIYHEDLDNTLTICYEFEETNNSLEGFFFSNVEKVIKESSLLADIVESEDKTMIAYTLYIPSELQSSYDYFSEGKYSLIPEEYKYEILEHINFYYKRYPDYTTTVKAVLFKEDTLRRKLSDDLGYTISKDMELSSICDTESETFKNELVTNDINSYN